MLKYDPVFSAPGSTSPATSAAVVTPSDTVAITGGPCRALYIGVAGDVAVLCAADTVAVVFKACPVGVLPVAATRVNATLTTATNIVALF